MKVNAAVFRSLPPHSFLLDLHRSRSIEQAVSWARPPLWATYCLAHSSDSCLLLSTNSPLLTLLKMPESQHQRPTVLCLHPGALSTAKPQRTTARNLAHQMMSGSPCRSTMALVQEFASALACCGFAIFPVVPVPAHRWDERACRDPLDLLSRLRSKRASCH